MVFAQPKFILFCALGSVLGLLVGAVPGLSVTMATALLVSLTYTWQAADALATVMGIYVVGVFSGALSAILLNIPGAPSSVATAFDGYPLARRGEARKALVYAACYSFTGCVSGLLALALLAKPVSAVALSFWPMDYVLLALFGLITVSTLDGNHFWKGIAGVICGFFCSLIGMDPVNGTPRFTFGVEALNTGISTVSALIGLFGLAETLSVLLTPKDRDQEKEAIPRGSVMGARVPLRELLRHFPNSLLYSLTGTLVGALPGAGTPVASLLAYAQAKRLVKKPSRPFGEGAVEGIVASESANNACIGGALIPLLTLGIPGDAVTAVMLSVFHIHGLQPGPVFFVNGRESFAAIIGAGFISSIFLLLLGLFVAPHLAGVIRVPKRILMPCVALVCISGAYAGNRRPFDVLVMLVFGLLGFWMKKHAFPVAPVTLALVLGRMTESNFRRALSLASSADHPLSALFARPVTLILLVLLILPPVCRLFRKTLKNHSFHKF